MTIIRWEDPPPSRFRWATCANELRQNPGRWARVLDPDTKQAATNARTALSGHGCEVVERKIDGEGTAVWARWPAGDVVYRFQ